MGNKSSNQVGNKSEFLIKDIIKHVVYPYIPEYKLNEGLFERKTKDAVLPCCTPKEIWLEHLQSFPKVKSPYHVAKVNTHQVLRYTQQFEGNISISLSKPKAIHRSKEMVQDYSYDENNYILIVGDFNKQHKYFCSYSASGLHSNIFDLAYFLMHEPSDKLWLVFSSNPINIEKSFEESDFCQELSKVFLF